MQITLRTYWLEMLIDLCITQYPIYIKRGHRSCRCLPLYIIRNKINLYCLLESAASWRVGGPSSLSQIRHSSRDRRMNFRIYSLILISRSVGKSSHAPLLHAPYILHLMTTKRVHARRTTLLVSRNRRRFYHHFSKMILSFGRPRSMRVFEIASIMGGGPHR